MSFWDSEIGEITGTAEDSFAKTFKQIPDGTMATAKIDSFVNVLFENTGFRFIEINWILTGGDFKGQKVQQKLKVYGGDVHDKDPAKTKHRSLNMFKLLYKLFGMKPRHANDPTDDDLALFVGKEAGIQIRETEPNEKGKQYNWVSEVHPVKGFKCETGVSVVVTHVNKSYEPVPEFTNDLSTAFSRNTVVNPPADDIPFN